MRGEIGETFGYKTSLSFPRGDVPQTNFYVGSIGAVQQYLPFTELTFSHADDVLTSETGAIAVLLTITVNRIQGALQFKRFFTIKRLTVNKR